MPTATTRHGTIHYEKSQVVHVLGGLVGFPDATHFVLLESDEVELPARITSHSLALLVR